jgi:amino acid transporter, AAT family
MNEAFQKEEGNAVEVFAGETGANVAREDGLHRSLTPWQIAMIGLGSTIGTGLFLGSVISVKLAGPAVLVSFVIGGLITLTVMWALAEMAAAHPAAGSFGLYAEMYVHPWAGFAVRYSYWMCLAFVIGSEVVAAAIYCRYWWPGVPPGVWIFVFSLALLLVNTIDIKSFGSLEFWFAMIKVVTILVFLVLGAALIFGVGFSRVGLSNYTSHGGFFPNGWRGIGLGVTMALFSFLGLEIVGATAGEAANPEVAVPRAMRRTLGFLVLFYLGGLAIVVGIIPWNELGLGESPFVRVFRSVGIAGAASVMNFVVLTAALSSAMCNLYFTARLLFSLARGGYAPARLGTLSKRGMPVAAVWASGVGLLLALLLAHFFERTAFVFMIGVAFFGGPFIWIMILITHLAFRREHERTAKPFLRLAPRGPWSSLFGLVGLVAVLISTWWVPGFRVTMPAGVAWLAFLTICYVIWSQVAMRRQTDAGVAPSKSV